MKRLNIKTQFMIEFLLPFTDAWKNACIYAEMYIYRVILQNEKFRFFP